SVETAIFGAQLSATVREGRRDQRRAQDSTTVWTYRAAPRLLQARDRVDQVVGDLDLIRVPDRFKPLHARVISSLRTVQGSVHIMYSALACAGYGCAKVDWSRLHLAGGPFRSALVEYRNARESLSR